MQLIPPEMDHDKTQECNKSLCKLPDEGCCQDFYIKSPSGKHLCLPKLCVVVVRLLFRRELRQTLASWFHTQAIPQ